MTDDITPIRQHGFRVVREKINIFTDTPSREVIDGIEDGQKVVFISVGPGETRLNVIDDEGQSIAAWVAVFGWSSLCDIDLQHRGEVIRMANISMINKALRSSLRLYGEDVDTTGFIETARQHLSGAVDYIVDRTIGDAKEYDRIILAAPVWLHGALEGCLALRPHIDPTIQEL